MAAIDSKYKQVAHFCRAFAHADACDCSASCRLKVGVTTFVATAYVERLTLVMSIYSVMSKRVATFPLGC